MVILDTNVIIDHLRKSEIQETMLMNLSKEFPKQELAISVISVQELYEGQSTRSSRKEEYLLATISPLKVLPFTYEIAKFAGEIARDTKKLIEFADAAIAATCIVHDGSLVTLNKRHFSGIPNLKFLKKSI